MLRLKSLRIISGMDRKELADMLNVSVQTLAKYEQGVAVPSIEKIIELGNIFNVTTDYLIGNEKEAIPLLENKKISFGEKVDILLKEIKEDLIKEIEKDLRRTFIDAVDVEIKEEIKELFKEQVKKNARKHIKKHFKIKRA